MSMVLEREREREREREGGRGRRRERGRKGGGRLNGPHVAAQRISFSLLVRALYPQVGLAIKGD